MEPVGNVRIRCECVFPTNDRLRILRAFLAAKESERGIVISQPTRGNLHRDVGALIKHLEILNARVAKIAAKDLEFSLREENITWGNFGDGVRDLNSTIERELTLVRMFIIEAEKQRYFEPERPLFGKDFVANYISAAFELDEAAKCLCIE
jgi:hypothetical protein